MGRFNWGEGSSSSPDIFDWLYGLILICFVAYFYFEAYLSWQKRRSKNLPGKTLSSETDLLIITLAGYAIAASIATGVVFKFLGFFGVVESYQVNKEAFFLLFVIFFGSLLFFKTKSYSATTQLNEFSPKTVSKQKLNAVEEKRLAQKKFDKKFVNELKIKIPDLVYVYSQNSASSLLNFIKIHQTENIWMNTNLMCIGEKTSSILNEIKWKKIFLFNAGEEEFLLYKI